MKTITELEKVDRVHSKHLGEMSTGSSVIRGVLDPKI